MARRDPRAELDKLVRRMKASESFVNIPQPNGESPVLAPQSALAAAFLSNSKYIDGEITAGAVHPVCWAAARSSDPSWRESFYSVPESLSAVEDLAE